MSDQSNASRQDYIAGHPAYGALGLPEDPVDLDVSGLVSIVRRLHALDDEYAAIAREVMAEANRHGSVNVAPYDARIEVNRAEHGALAGYIGESTVRTRAARADHA